MKRISLFFILLGIACAGTQVAQAQENGNRNEKNEIVRGPYLTNDAGANWWISLGGGITVFGDGGCTPAVTPALDFNFGKWFTPSIGARIGYQGLTGSMLTSTDNIYVKKTVGDQFKMKFGYAYAHADFMWNISNAFSGYKETRFWNVIPYVHTGLLAVYKTKGHHGADLEFASGAGLYNTLRLCDRVNLTLDLRGILTNGRQLQNKGGVAGELSLTVGVAVNLGKTNWKRTPEKVADESVLAKVSELEMANQALVSEKNELAAVNEDLSEANEDLVAANEELQQTAALLAEQAEEETTPHTFYFVIGQTRLSAVELARLDLLVTTELSSLDEDDKIVLTVRNDSKTGSVKRNEYLSRERTKYIKNILVKKYGIDENRFEIVPEVVDTQRPELDRCVDLIVR